MLLSTWITGCPTAFEKDVKIISSAHMDGNYMEDHLHEPKLLHSNDSWKVIRVQSISIAGLSVDFRSQKLWHIVGAE